MTLGSAQNASRDRTRAIVVLALAVVEILSSPITTLLTGSGAGVGGVSDDYSSPVTPAGYAFAIWGLIYLAALAYGVYQVLPSQRGREVQRRTGWWVAAAFACSTVWIPIFTAQVVWLSQIVIVALVACLAVAMVRATRTGPAHGLAEQALLRLPITLYLGWTVLAATAGFGATFRSLGMPAEAGWVTAVSVLLVLIATGVCVIIVGRGSALASFAFTACWALVAIVAVSTSTLVSVAAVLAVLIVAATLIVRTGRSQDKSRILLG